MQAFPKSQMSLNQPVRALCTYGELFHHHSLQPYYSWHQISHDGMFMLPNPRTKYFHDMIGHIWIIGINHLVDNAFHYQIIIIIIIIINR